VGQTGASIASKGLLVDGAPEIVRRAGNPKDKSLGVIFFGYFLLDAKRK
jgi:hypothetical protein